MIRRTLAAVVGRSEACRRRFVLEWASDGMREDSESQATQNDGPRHGWLMICGTAGLNTSTTLLCCFRQERYSSVKSEPERARSPVCLNRTGVDSHR